MDDAVDRPLGDCGESELQRRGVIASARLRQPALALDDIAHGQLARFIDRQLAETG